MHVSDSKISDLPSIMPAVRKSARISIPPDRYGFNSSRGQSTPSAFSATLHSTVIPTNYSQAAKEACW